jgi:hypothetical protein
MVYRFLGGVERKGYCKNPEALWSVATISCAQNPTKAGFQYFVSQFEQRIGNFETVQSMAMRTLGKLVDDVLLYGVPRSKKHLNLGVLKQ